MGGGYRKPQPESAAAWAVAIFRNDSQICAVRSLRLSVQFARVNRFVYLFRCLIYSLVKYCMNAWPEMNRFRNLADGMGAPMSSLASAPQSKTSMATRKLG
jgi:hypothetical protein